MLRRGAVCAVAGRGLPRQPRSRRHLLGERGHRHDRSHRQRRGDRRSRLRHRGDGTASRSDRRHLRLLGTRRRAGRRPAGNIGRAPLDGTTPNQTFVSTAAPPGAGGRQHAHLLDPAASDRAGKPGSIGRATLGGQFPAQNFVATGPTPCGVASNADDIYWGNGGSPGSIGSSHGSFSVLQNFITATSDPCGVAQSEGLLYWTNRAGEHDRRRQPGRLQSGPET